MTPDERRLATWLLNGMGVNLSILPAARPRDVRRCLTALHTLGRGRGQPAGLTELLALDDAGLLRVVETAQTAHALEQL